MLYQEEDDSVIQHDGKYYSVNQILKDTQFLPSRKLAVSVFEQHITPSTLDQERIERADLNAPIVYTIDPKWGYVVLDGAHRVAKAMLTGVKTIHGKKIPTHWLVPIKERDVK